MLRRRISKAGVVLALALACGTSAHAESSLDAVRARGRIRVGVKTDAAPFGFIDARGHSVGFEVDLARFFARVLLDDDVAVLALARRDPALRVTGAPIRPRAYVAAARKEDTGLIRWVNGWLAKMRRDGTYRGLWRRYFTPFESHLVGA